MAWHTSAQFAVAQAQALAENLFSKGYVSSIEHGKIFNTVGKFFAIFTDLRRKLVQDSTFFIALLQLQFTHRIIQLNDGPWFHK